MKLNEDQTMWFGCALVAISYISVAVATWPLHNWRGVVVACGCYGILKGTVFAFGGSDTND